MRAITRRFVEPRLFAPQVVSQKARWIGNLRMARKVAQASDALAMTGSAFKVALPGRPKTKSTTTFSHHAITSGRA